jgi:cytochrome c oxidase assembly protein subunit 15
MMVPMDRLTRFSWFVLAYNVAVILWGAVVRATGSGAGCGSHWPLCNGVMLPRAPRVETVIEFSHRLTSGLALLLVLALAVAAFRLRPAGNPTRKSAVVSAVLMLSEAAVGAALVLFRLVADNQSMARAMFMGSHLTNTFLLLAALALTAHFAGGGAPFRLRSRGWLGAGFVCGALALLLSGVSGAVAALGDTLFPSTSLAEALRQDMSATGHLLIRLRLLHPAISIIAGLLALLLTIAPMAPRSAGWARWSRLTAALVFAQWMAGLVNVALLAPVWMQIVHLFVADLLWIAFVLLAASAVAVEALDPQALRLYRARAAPP